jgi:hypothetical protein
VAIIIVVLSLCYFVGTFVAKKIQNPAAYLISVIAGFCTCAAIGYGLVPLLLAFFNHLFPGITNGRNLVAGPGVWSGLFGALYGTFEYRRRPESINTRTAPREGGTSQLVKGFKIRESAKAAAKQLAGARVGFGFTILGIIPLLIWLFTPNDRDRWIKMDGSVMCKLESDIGEIGEMKSRDSRKWIIEELVKAEKCDLAYADERVRLIAVSDNSAYAEVIIERNGERKWMEVSDLRLRRYYDFAIPWLATVTDNTDKDLTAPPQL